MTAASASHLPAAPAHRLSRAAPGQQLSEPDNSRMAGGGRGGLAQSPSPHALSLAARDEPEEGTGGGCPQGPAVLGARRKPVSQEGSPRVHGRRARGGTSQPRRHITSRAPVRANGAGSTKQAPCCRRGAGGHICNRKTKRPRGRTTLCESEPTSGRGRRGQPRLRVLRDPELEALGQKPGLAESSGTASAGAGCSVSRGQPAGTRQGQRQLLQRSEGVSVPAN